MSDTKTPGYLFHLVCDTGNGKQLQVSTNFPSDTTIEAMNAEVDKINTVMDRLRAKHECPLIEERLEGTRQQLESQETDLELYLKKYGEKARDAAQVNKMQQQIAALKVAIARGEITLAETRLKAQ